MTLKVRAMQACDIPAAVAMIEALTLHHGDAPRVTPESLARDCTGEDPWIKLVVADMGGDLVGYVALSRLVWLQYGDRGIEMNHLFVQPEWRGKGVGQALIAAAKDAARAAGCVEMKVSTHPENLAAQEFYLAQGFASQEVTGARFRFYL